MPYSTIIEKGSARLSTEGKDYKQVFAEGGRGLFHLMFDTDRIKDVEQVEFALQAEDIPSLYQEWLKELLARYQNEKIIFGEFSILSIQKASAKQFVLMARASGERYDTAKHVSKAVISKIKSAGAVCREKDKRYYCELTVELSQ